MVETRKVYIFDFDSTITRVEALDVLAEISLANDPKKDEIIAEIKEITNLGIDGDISFTESLERRIKLLNANKADLAPLVKELKGKITKSIECNKEFFDQFADFVFDEGQIEILLRIRTLLSAPSAEIVNTFCYVRRIDAHAVITAHPPSQGQLDLFSIVHAGFSSCKRALCLFEEFI